MSRDSRLNFDQLSNNPILGSVVDSNWRQSSFDPVQIYVPEKMDVENIGEQSASDKNRFASEEGMKGLLNQLLETKLGANHMR